MTQLRARASRADLGWECPAALHPVTVEGTPVTHVDSAGEAALVGVVVHDMMSSYRDPAKKTPDPLHIMDLHGLSESKAEEVAYLFGQGVYVWTQIKHEYPDPLLEVSMRFDEPGLTLTGKADVIAVVGDEVRVNDDKTGRVTTGYHHQVKQYGFLALNYYPECERVVLRRSWLRDGVAEEPVMYTRSEMQDWYRTYKQRLVNGAGSFSPGDHCTYCSRRGSCPAYAQHVGKALATFDPDAGVGDLIERPDLEVVMAKLDMIDRYREDLRDAVKRRIEEHGPIAISDGRELAVTETKAKEIDPRKGWGIVFGAIDRDEEAMSKCVKFRMTELRKAVKALHPRGTKQEAWNAFENELTLHDALGETCSKRLVKRLKETSDDDGSECAGTKDGGAAGPRQQDAGEVAGE